MEEVAQESRAPGVLLRRDPLIFGRLVRVRTELEILEIVHDVVDDVARRLELPEVFG